MIKRALILLTLLITLGLATSVQAAPRIAGVGANFGNACASQIPLDIPGATFTPVSEAAFNAMSVAQLRANFDVLIFTWISDPAVNADWNTRLLPYMALGGGIIFEDPGNLLDLAPGVTAMNFDTGAAGLTVSAAVPGLTDGIANSFDNNHIKFTAWDPRLSPFLDLNGIVVGLWGDFPGCGRIVLTGPDQHFHGFRGAGNPAGNQYNLLLNEVRFVTEGKSCEVPVDIKPTSCPNPLNTNNQGLLPVAILGTNNIDVTQIDVATVKLAGVSPLKSDLEDVATPFSPFTGKQDCNLDCTTAGPDGFLDLTLKFDAQAVIAALGAVTDGQCLVLKLTGNLLDGSPIKGEDVVVIRKKK